MSEHPANRRIDRIREPSFAVGIEGMDLDELRARRDECMAEREYLSLLRRLLQGRAEILRAEVEARGAGGGGRTELVEHLTAILTGDEHTVTSRGEAMRVTIPEDELLLARRRVEKLAGDAGISDPASLDDSTLAGVIQTLSAEERTTSEDRRTVIDVLDRFQGELKRRYKDDPSLALR